MTELPSLAELSEFVKELKTRVLRYSAELRESGELVKSSLVEPFLRLLGFDPEDPADVRPHYATQLGVADYALLNEGNVLALVLARKPGSQPNVQEGLRMCIAGRVGYLILTDGIVWSVYSRDGGKLMEWSLDAEPPEELFRKIDAFRRLLGLESGRYEEELKCYTKGGKEVRIKILDSMDGLLIRRARYAGKLPYSHIAKMLAEGRTVFLSGGVDNKNITYIRKRIEQEVGAEVECFPAVYEDVIGYSITLKSPKRPAANCK
ncbi:MAG: hypothetical protein QXG35_00400 [Nitrososphaerota archaeon]